LRLKQVGEKLIQTDAICKGTCTRHEEVIVLHQYFIISLRVVLGCIQFSINYIK